LDVGDALDRAGEAIAVAWRQVLPTQVERAASAGLRFHMASEVEAYFL
jgi:hypothetical protein